MIETLQQDSLEMAQLYLLAVERGHISNVWMWIAIVLVVVILVLVAALVGKNSNTCKKKDAILAKDPDFANLFNSAFNSESLYKDLVKKCHPDRFAPNAEKMALADELCQRVSKSRNNIKELEMLRDEIQQKLSL